MTEIKIEKKKPIWPWILGAVLLIGAGVAIWFLLMGDDKNDPLTTKDETTWIDTKEDNNTVGAYITFIESDTNTMGLDHVYTHEALTKLTNAVEAMANEVDYDVKADIAKAKEYADSITKDRLETTHANKIKSAAKVLSNALLNIQQARYPSLSSEATGVKSAAAAINPDALTLDQRDAVKSFFSKAADLLHKMN